MHGHLRVKYFSYIYTGTLRKTTATLSLRARCVMFVVQWLTDSTVQHFYADYVKINEISASPTKR